MSDTPRTDEAIAAIGFVHDEYECLKDECRKLERELIEANARISNTRGWIPVRERLPKHDSVVLAFSPCTNSLRVNTARYMGPGGFKDGWITVMDHPVTHWMPLPEEPK